MDSPYVNRELSWLSFNERVLEEATESNNPLYERIKFASIFLSNLDEFFMVRVGALISESRQKNKKDTKTHLTPAQQLDAVYSRVDSSLPGKDKIVSKLFKNLAKNGIELVDCSELKSKEYDYLNLYFQREILPVLSPQIMDFRHPFPFLSNLQQYLGLWLGDSKNHFFGIVPINPSFPRFVRLPSNHLRFVLMEDLLTLFAPRIFKKYKVNSAVIFRVTRNADISIQDPMFDAAPTYKDAMRELLRTRKSMGAIRLESYMKMPQDMLAYLLKKLSLTEKQYFLNQTPLDLRFVYDLENYARPIVDSSLFYPKAQTRTPHIPNPDQPILPQVLQKDVLLYYPYDSMDTFIQLLNEAAEDSETVSIKITLYRMAKNSKIISALIKAHEMGKEVFAVVELRARFDEQSNIDWASRLEDAGIHLSYGLDDYKTHSKLCLITRQTEQGLSYITQIGTGNYNEKTATQYSDYCLMTADEDIAEDAVDFFQKIALGKVVKKTRKLLIAPKVFRSKLVDCIDEQIIRAVNAQSSAIFIKVNSITDKRLIDKLIEASKAGVPVTMVVRGICCLKPGIKGETENIRVISIIGRYLEHSRIYSFGEGESQKLYISSGDWMTRSTKNRVEIASPVEDADLKHEINMHIEAMLNDNVNAREMKPSGKYRLVKNSLPEFDSQSIFYET